MSESDTPAKVGSMEGLGLRAWLVERYESAMAIAARKTNADRAGWLEDAAYFKAAVKALDGRTEAVAAERERCAKLCEQEHSESGEHPEMALHCAERIRGLLA